MLEKGPQIGQPVTGIKITINDGSSHAVDSSDIAFQEASRGAWRQSFPKAAPVILEPIMKVECEGPGEFTGAMVSTLMGRRGMIIGSAEEGGFARVEAEVPLSEMFGYSTSIRSATQGKAEFTMEFSRYAKAPDAVAVDLIKKHEEEKTKGRK